MHGVTRTIDELKRQVNRGQNYERLYRELKPKYDTALTRIDELEAQLATQEQRFTAQLQTQAVRIEQLESMVFGKKPRLPRQPKLRLAAKRDAHTYHRPIPPTAAVTATEYCATDQCQRCGHELTDRTEVIRYEEDIELATCNPRLPMKRVTKYVVGQGWCSACGQWSSARDLRGPRVQLGPVVRAYVTYLVCRLNLSYAETQDVLWQQHGFRLASSEITEILTKQSVTLLPTFTQLQERIRAGPAHFDETRCPIQSEQGSGYAWVMAGADGGAAEHDVVFKLADDRGSGNAEQLAGASYASVGVTDRYAGYKHLFALGKHQICWAHLQRNARDITKLSSLDETVHQQTIGFYRELCSIYTSVRRYWCEPYDRHVRQQQANALLAQTKMLCQPEQQDPKQLQDLKAGILEYQSCLFICLTEPNVPPDNNKAERALRRLVLKRKKSFGVRTKKAAHVMEILLSVCQSLHNRAPDHLLANLHQLAIAG